MKAAPILAWRLHDVEPTQPEIEAQVGSRIRQRLAQSAYRAVQRVACEFRDGRLLLRGQIPTYLRNQVTQLVREELDQSSRDLDRQWQLVELP